MYTIVVARVEMTGIRKTGRQVMRDRNWFPEIEAAPEAKTCIWLNAGTPDDVESARTFAAKEGYTVFTYPTDDPDPRGRASREVMEQYDRR